MPSVQPLPGPDYFALTPARGDAKKNKSNGTIKVILKHFSCCTNWMYFKCLWNVFQIVACKSSWFIILIVLSRKIENKTNKLIKIWTWTALSLSVCLAITALFWLYQGSSIIHTNLPSNYISFSTNLPNTAMLFLYLLVVLDVILFAFVFLNFFWFCHNSWVIILWLLNRTHRSLRACLTEQLCKIYYLTFLYFHDFFL